MFGAEDTPKRLWHWDAGSRPNTATATSRKRAGGYKAGGARRVNLVLENHDDDGQACLGPNASAFSLQLAIPRSDDRTKDESLGCNLVRHENNRIRTGRNRCVSPTTPVILEGVTDAQPCGIS
jgi:hypothetical protein